jgi:hypothetical protein
MSWKKFFRLLENAGQDVNNPSMLVIAESKFPEWVHNDLYFFKEFGDNSDDWNLEKFRKSVDKVITRRETSSELAKNYGMKPTNENRGDIHQNKFIKSNPNNRVMVAVDGKNPNMNKNKGIQQKQSMILGKRIKIEVVYFVMRNLTWAEIARDTHLMKVESED